MSGKNEIYENGLALLDKLHGGHAGEQMVEAMKDICPDFAAMTLGATKEQIVEVLLTLIFYAGGAAVANALTVAGEVFKSREEA